MKVQLKEVKIFDLDHRRVKAAPGQELYKHIANAIYTKTGSLDMLAIVELMNKGLAVEMSSSQIAEMIAIIESPKSGIFAFVKKAVLDYLIKVQEIDKKKTAKKVVKKVAKKVAKKKKAKRRKR